MSIFAENPAIESDNWAVEKLYEIHNDPWDGLYLTNKETGYTYQCIEELYDRYRNVRTNVCQWAYDTAKLNNVPPESYSIPTIGGMDILFQSQFQHYFESYCQDKVLYKGNIYYNSAWCSEVFEQPIYASYFDWLAMASKPLYFTRDQFEIEREKLSYECFRQNRSRRYTSSKVHL